jgi:hypothetical protein
VKPLFPTTRADELEQRFQAFHKLNPEGYRLFVRFTFEVINRGHKHYSADAVIQRIRWHTDVETYGDEFKINDHFTRYYAELFHRDHSANATFFRCRKQTSTTAQPIGE